MIANTPRGPVAGSRPGGAGSSGAGGGLAPSRRGGEPGTWAGHLGSEDRSVGLRRAQRWYLFHISRRVLLYQIAKSPILVAIVTKPIIRRADRTCYST